MQADSPYNDQERTDTAEEADEAAANNNNHVSSTKQRDNTGQETGGGDKSKVTKSDSIKIRTQNAGSLKLA